MADAPADVLLKRLLEVAQSEDHTGSFPTTARWIREVSARRDERSLARRVVGARPLRLVYLGLITLALLAVARVPITQQETIGQVLSWTTELPVAEATALVAKEPWTEPFQVAVSSDSRTSVTTFFLTMPGVSEREVESYLQTLRTMHGVVSVARHPLHEQVQRPAYTVLLRPFRVHVNATHRSDADIEAHLEAQMQALGMSGVEVQFERDEDGVPHIQVEAGAQAERHLSDVTLYLLDDPANLNQGLSFDPEAFEGKSKEEIEQLIRAALQAQGLPDMEIIVTESPLHIQLKAK